MIVTGARFYRTIGKWGEDGTMWFEGLDKWERLVDEGGRVRVKWAPREKVLWSVVFWEELFGKEEEEVVVGCAGNGEG